MQNSQLRINLDTVQGNLISKCVSQNLLGAISGLQS
jgi:hypothetical protein